MVCGRCNKVTVGVLHLYWVSFSVMQARRPRERDRNKTQLNTIVQILRLIRSTVATDCLWAR